MDPQWTVGDRSQGIIQQSTGRYNINFHHSMSASYSTLTVNSATREDQGEYTCTYIIDDYRPEQTINATLIEVVQIITETELSYQVQLCEPISLNCTALHHDSIKWTKLPDSKEVLNTSDGRVILLSDQLLIQEARLGDNGTYMCSAENVAGSTSILAKLNIIGKYACIN